ncbi:MAG TPA: transcription antitermination factor NusB [Verrucomicrobiae bacterium]|nr:transcription antitermination factor NusB [Verrucomicrobiae bacterium]
MEKPVKGPGKRRLARELAVQFLYQFEVSGGAIEEALALFWQTQPEVGDPGRRFAEELVRGVVENRAAIDEKIAKYTEHWDLPRIAAVDRNILRLAIYEMLYRDDIPPVVSINEAVDIAKKFSTRESGAFVNGILDRLKADLTRPSRTAAGTGRE